MYTFYAVLSAYIVFNFLWCSFSVSQTIWFVTSMFSMVIISQPTILRFALTDYISNKRIDKQYEY